MRLINLPIHECYFETKSVANQNGLVARFNSGYWGFELGLFTNLHQLELFKYSEKTSPAHYSDIYSGKLDINTRKDRDLHAAEALRYKVITEVNYAGILELHENWLKLSNRIYSILKKYLSQWCQFEAKVFGVSLKFGSSGYYDSPIYNYLIDPVINQIGAESKLGLIYSYGKLVHTKVNNSEIDCEEFENIVKQVVQDNLLKYQIYEQEELDKNNFSNEKLAQAFGISQEALSTVTVNEKKDIEIIFSKAYQKYEFLHSICNSLKQQRIITNIQGEMIVIPFNERERLKKFIDKGESFCILTNHHYSYIKNAFNINSNVFLQLFRDVSYCYIRTEPDSQISIYRMLKQNYIDCNLQEKGVVRLPVNDIKEFNLLIECLLEKKPTKYELCSTLRITHEQVRIGENDYIISFPSKAACEDFEKFLKSLSLGFFNKDRSSPNIIKIYNSKDFRSLINDQTFLLAEKKLEQYLLNDYNKAKTLGDGLSQYHNAPYNKDWLKQKLGKELLEFKEDFWGLSFCLQKGSDLYAKAEKYFNKLNCGNAPLTDQFFKLRKNAKWHIICAVECILGNEINTDKIFNYDEKIEKNIQDYLNTQKLQNEYNPHRIRPEENLTNKVSSISIFRKCAPKSQEFTTSPISPNV